ncbi:MAG: hypothetical protein RLY43_2269 [Bacteroidota bacterium]
MDLKRKTFLAAIGDSNNSSTWSGIPYFFLNEGKKHNLIDFGLNLDPNTYFHRICRVFWNIFRVLFFFERGGYQYSNFFLVNLWRPHLNRIKGGRVINCFQLYPKALLDQKDIELYFFIDQTLIQLFELYNVNTIIGKHIIKSSLKLEKLGYERADKIFVHSNWCKESLVNDYLISENKIFVVQPGANIFPETYLKFQNSSKSLMDKDGPLKLIFIGKEPVRKGLDRLLLALKYAQNLGASITLRVIGCDKSELKLSDDMLPEFVEWVGFLDKSKSFDEYFSLISECDLGCLLSKAEAGGICLREFHALGLAVMYSEVGGSPEHVIGEASIGISANMSIEEIGETLIYYSNNREKINSLKVNSINNSSTMLWSSTVSLINDIIN